MTLAFVNIEALGIIELRHYCKHKIKNRVVNEVHI